MNLNIVSCLHCGEEFECYDDDAVQVTNGFVHNDCLKEYCEDYCSANMPDMYKEYAKDFAMQEKADFFLGYLASGDLVAPFDEDWLIDALEKALDKHHEFANKPNIFKGYAEDLDSLYKGYAEKYPSAFMDFVIEQEREVV